MRLRTTYRYLLALGVTSMIGCNERFDFDAPTGSGGSAGQANTGGTTSSPSHCSVDADCGLETLHCDAQSGFCFECVVDTDCAVQGLPRCDGALHRCVECGLDADCGSGIACDTRTRLCTQVCIDDDTCPSRFCDDDRLVCAECELYDDDGCLAYPDRPFCGPAGNRCVACVSDQNCSPGLHCDAVLGRCVGCRDSRDCVTGEVCDPAAYVCVVP